MKTLVLGRSGRRREAGGAAAQSSHGLWWQAHERWSYDDVTRVQSLRRWVCLCTRCHRSTHFGFAEVIGQGPQAHADLCAVNGWTDAGVVPARPAPAAPDRRHIASDTLHRTTRDT